MNQPQRIAVISVHGCPLLPPGNKEAGGMNVYIGMLSAEMARRGIQVDVFSRWHNPDDPEITTPHHNVRVIHLKAGNREFLTKDDIYPHLPEFLSSLLAFQQREGLTYDAIHSHYWLSGWVGAFLRRRWRVPHVTMFHTMGAVKNQARAGEHETSLRIRTELKVMRGADAIVVASPQEGERMMRLYPGMERKVRVIPCGVDLDIFRPLDMRSTRQRLGLNGEKILLFVGRPDPLKGLNILINAASQLEQPEGVRVLVVGGELEHAAPFEEAMSLAQTLDMDRNISFMGSVTQSQLPLYYNAADVCVIPSYYESFGLVALEAMACATPVVASRVGGLQSTVRDGETGYLVPWHCPEPFAERLELLLDNETLRHHLGAAGRVAAQAYRWPAVAARILELYDELRTQPAFSEVAHG